MVEYLIKEMERKQGVTEELKGKDMMRWIGLMNNIRACAVFFFGKYSRSH